MQYFEDTDIATAIELTAIAKLKAWIFLIKLVMIKSCICFKRKQGNGRY